MHQQALYMQKRPPLVASGGRFVPLYDLWCDAARVAKATGDARDDGDDVDDNPECGETSPNHAAKAPRRHRAALVRGIAVSVERLQGSVPLHPSDGAEDDAEAENADNAHNHNGLAVDHRAAAHRGLAAGRGEYIGLLMRASLLCQ